MLGRFGPLIPDLKDWKARRLLRKKVSEIVRLALWNTQERKFLRAEEGKKRRYVFVEHLAERTRDPIVLRDQLMSGLLGGRDTTSNLLGNLFYVLARRPEVWQKLKAEIRQIEHQPPTMKDIQGAKYARNCIQECKNTFSAFFQSVDIGEMLTWPTALRLHPVVPINQRWASKDAVLPCGGDEAKSSVTIPKGSNIYIYVYTMHRRKDVYGEDANEFRPERWEEGLKPGWAFVPFGGGPRLCIGRE